MRKIPFLLSISLFWLVLSILSDGMNALLLPERLLRLNGSQSQATTLGLFSFVGLLAGMLVQPLAGAWSDRLRPVYGRKAGLAVGTLAVLIALAIFGLSAGWVGLALGYILIQVGLSVVQAAQQGFIPDQVPAKERGLASGMKSFMDIGGAMIGFVLLGQLLGQGRPSLAILVMGGMLLAALALTALLVREPRQAAASGGQRGPTTGSPFRVDFRRYPQFLWLVISRFFFLLGTYAVGRFLLLFVASRLGLSPENAAEAAGNVLAGLALITVVSAPLAGWLADRVGRAPLMWFGALISAVGVLGYIFAGNLSQIFAFGGLLSLGSAAFATANWAMTADVVPKEDAARYFGIANFGTAGSAAAAGLFGLLVDQVNRIAPGSGFSALFLAAAAAFLISAISLLGLRNPATAPAPERTPFTTLQPAQEKHPDRLEESPNRIANRDESRA